MRRRALLSATATALAIPLVAGCSRDDGGGGDGGDGDSGDGGGGGGPYGAIVPPDPQLSAEDADGSDVESRSRGPDGPALGPEPR